MDPTRWSGLAVLQHYKERYSCPHHIAFERICATCVETLTDEMREVREAHRYLDECGVVAHDGGGNRLTMPARIVALDSYIRGDRKS